MLFFSIALTMSQWDIKMVSLFSVLLTLSSHPVQKIFPTAKLTAKNAGELELTLHHRAIAAAAAAPQRRSTPSSPCSGPPELLEPTPAMAVDPTSPELVPACTLTTNKCPRACSLLQATSISSIQTVPEVYSDSNDTPKLKKAKVTPHQAESILQAKVSIIEIDDDDDDQQVEQLNKMGPTADVKTFFTEVLPVPGQNNGHMKCNLCT